MKGRKTGGKVKGTPNKSTIEKIKEASNRVAEAKKAGRKQAVDVLDDLMHSAMGMAARYQPMPTAENPIPTSPNEQKFMEWLQVAGVFAKALADFQSPKFRAIMVTPTPPPAPDAPTIDQQGNVLDMDDPRKLARVYQSLVRRVG